MVDITRIESLKREIKDIEVKLADEDLPLEDILKLKEAKIKKEQEIIELFKQSQQDEESSIITLQEAINLYNKMPKKPKYSTGIGKLDNELGGGFEMAQLVVVAGEKGAGKTALTMQILFNVSKGYKTMLFSLEMPYWKITERFLKKNPQGKILENLRIADKRFFLEDIETLIRFHAKKGTKFFVIDSLMKLQTVKDFRKKNERISYISSSLSKLAIELDIVIFLIAQMSKEDIKGRHLAIKDSGDVEYDADVMVFLLKDKNHPKKRKIVCTKNRQNGNEFSIELYIDKNTLNFQEQEIEIVYKAGEIIKDMDELMSFMGGEDD